MVLHWGWNNISANLIQTIYNTVGIHKWVNQQGYERYERIHTENPSVHNQTFSLFNILYLQRDQNTCIIKLCMQQKFWKFTIFESLLRKVYYYLCYCNLHTWFQQFTNWYIHLTIFSSLHFWLLDSIVIYLKCCNSWKSLCYSRHQFFYSLPKWDCAQIHGSFDEKFYLHFIYHCENLQLKFITFFL